MATQDVANGRNFTRILFPFRWLMTLMKTKGCMITFAKCAHFVRMSPHDTHDLYVELVNLLPREQVFEMVLNRTLSFPLHNQQFVNASVQQVVEQS